MCTLCITMYIVHNFHRHLNSIEPSIQFTLEAESERQLVFLDVLSSHNPDGSMDTTGYKKPSHTNKYLDFSSHHPLAHKIALVRTLYSRAQALTSSAVTRTQEQHTISKALAQTGYPATFNQVAVFYYMLLLFYIEGLLTQHIS